MSIREILDRLLANIENSLQCVREVGVDLSSPDDIKKRISTYVIAFAFLEVYISWENFLEGTMIAYALQELGTEGVRPNCYISPTDEEHAYSLIKGAAFYPEWSKLDEVLSCAERLFENGEPYRSALQNISSHLSEMKTIRNAISHNSENSRKAFENLVRGRLLPADVGISVSEFLLRRKQGSSFIELYFTFTANAAQSIAKGNV
jgi:hypothetical protein